MYYPLASNIDMSGKKLFARMTGLPKVTVNANSTHNFEYVIPYPEVKINSTEVVGCNMHDTVSFYVFDSNTGQYTGVPNALLNQYGFTVNLGEKFHQFHSEYPGILFQNMKVRVEYINNSATSCDVSVNLRMHELK